jgi:hypothetical protein
VGLWTIGLADKLLQVNFFQVNDTSSAADGYEAAHMNSAGSRYQRYPGVTARAEIPFT